MIWCKAPYPSPLAVKQLGTGDGYQLPLHERSLPRMLLLFPGWLLAWSAAAEHVQQFSLVQPGGGANLGQ